MSRNNNSVNNVFLNQPVTTVTGATYTALPSDAIIAVNFAGTVAITLPTASASNKGKSYVVKDSSGSASTNAITISPASGNIDGASSTQINTNYGYVETFSDGTNWYTQAASEAPFGLIKIETKTAVSDSSVTFTDLSQYPYTNYRLVCTFTAYSSVLLLQFSTNNGSTYLSNSYQSGIYYINASNTGSSFFASTTSTTGCLVATTTFTSGSLQPSVTDIFGINQSTVRPSTNTQLTGNTAGNCYYGFGVGNYNGTITPNAFRVAGTTFSGKLTLYGYA